MRLNVENEEAISKLYEFYCEAGFEKEADELQLKILKSDYDKYNLYYESLLRNVVLEYFYQQYGNEEDWEDLEDILNPHIEDLIQMSCKDMKKNIKRVMRGDELK